MATDRIFRRGQALMELAIGMFALALVVCALCGFAMYIAKSLKVQNHLRTGGPKSDSLEVEDFAAEHIFGTRKIPIKEKLQFPETTILK